MKPIFSFLIVAFLSTAALAQQPRWVRTGQYGGITGLAFSPDGRYLASIASEDNRILVWDTKALTTMPEVLLFPRNPGHYSYNSLPGSAIIFSNDGTRVFAPSDTGIYVWDFNSKALVDSIVPLTAGVIYLQLSSSGDSLLWVCGSGLVVRYNLTTRALIDSVTLVIEVGSTTQMPRNFSISEDLNAIAYVQFYDSLMLYSYASRTATRISNARIPSSPVLNSDGSRLAFSDIDSSLVVDISSGKHLYSFPGYNRITPITFSNSGNSLIYSDSSLVELNLQNGDSTIIGIWPGTVGYFDQSVYALSPAKTSLAVGSVKWGPIVRLALNGSIVLADFSTGTDIELTGNESDITGIEWSPNKDILTASDNASLVKSFAGADGIALASYYGDWSQTQIGGMDYSRDGTRVAASFLYYDEAAGSSNHIGYLNADDLSSGPWICTDYLYTIQPSALYGIYLSSAGSSVIAGNQLVDSGEGCTPISLHYPHAYGFSPDGSQILAGDSSALVTIDVKTQDATPLQISHASPITSARFTWDGDGFLVSYADSSVELFHYPSCASITRIGGPGTSIFNASLSQSARYLLSNTNDSTLQIWDLSTGTIIYTYAPFSEPIQPIGFSYDQKYIAAFSGPTIIVWDAPANMKVEEPPAALAMTLTQNLPNPASTSTSFSYTLPYSESVTIGLYDVMGREVRVLADGRANAGTHFVTLGAEMLATLAPGVYYYRLESASGVAARRMVVR